MPEAVKGELTENESKMFDAIKDGDILALRSQLKCDDVRIDCLDKYGTTPLQQAAFKGNAEICAILLAHGADVNADHHEHGYTSLMFGALSGNPEVCRLLLEAGARSEKTNSVNKTASELAAFTGQHQCVAMINNHFSIENIEFFTRPRGSETTARLPGNLAPILYKLIGIANVHPVKTLLFVMAHPEIIEHEKAVLYVMEELFEQQMKQKETNEVMALKIHVIFKTLKAMFKFMNESNAGSDKSAKVHERLMKFVKHLLATKDSNFPMNLELFVRQVIKEFPYHTSVLFQQIVRTVAKIQPGVGTPALTILNQAILGQRMLSDEIFCVTCGEPGARKHCSACKMTNYCSVDCQKIHWFAHKQWCPQLKKEHDKMQAGAGDVSGEQKKDQLPNEQDLIPMSPESPGDDEK